MYHGVVAAHNHNHRLTRIVNKEPIVGRESPERHAPILFLTWLRRKPQAIRLRLSNDVVSPVSLSHGVFLALAFQSSPPLDYHHRLNCHPVSTYKLSAPSSIEGKYVPQVRPRRRKGPSIVHRIASIYHMAST